MSRRVVHARADSPIRVRATGHEDRYFDIFVEYAKESPEDILIQISIYNRGPEPARLDVLPTLWFRNTWSWQPALGTLQGSSALPWEMRLPVC